MNLRPIALLSMLFFFTTASQGELANTAYGKVSGITDGQTFAYLSIPYAAPPVGSLRLKDPVAPQKWSNVRAADKLPPFCPQTSLSSIPGSSLPYAEISEDCLYLNVWAPKTAKVGSALPVMFWIHGGGDVSGGSAGEPLVTVAIDPANPSAGKKPWPTFYNGANLATKAGVVVVSINYRLGVLGNFPHPALSAENGAPTSNLGHLDKIFALKWVAQNIANFGGDPNNVTIFGESAGGVGVCTLMASPLAKGLFHRGITESGPCESIPMGDLPQKSTTFATNLGCSTTECLRELPVSAILAQQDLTPLVPYVLDGSTYLYHGGPVEDGRIISLPMQEIFKRGLHNKVPLIVGSNAAEFPVFVLPKDEQANLTNSEFYDSLTAQFGPDSGAAIYNAHDPSLLTDLPAGTTAAANAKAATLSATLSPCPLRHAAKIISGSQTSPVYRFIFDQTIMSSIQKLSCKQNKNCAGNPYALGPIHGMELFFTFQHIEELYNEVINPGLAAKGATTVLSPGAAEQGTQSVFSLAYRTFSRSSVPQGWKNYLETSDIYNFITKDLSAKAGYEKQTCDAYDKFVYGE